MLRNMLANMFCRLLITHPFMVTERDIANIFIKVMLIWIAIVVRFVSSHRMLVPLAGKNTLSAYCFKTSANATNSGKKIDKTKSIIWMMRGRRGKQVHYR